ncbi:unnamed protein product [Dracunculus medinensis]|uniref:PlsC domain-containing protein n=1 Tax=Dracunculus medinensis TaxID=318479 RepID=A0A0N4URV1_DRAME|nr:unnamed protein product [Dracunculus medinensis]
MLTPGAEQISGIDGSTMNVEDSFITKIVANSMDLRKIIAVIGSFYWIIMTIFIVPCAVVATFLTILLPIILINVRIYNWIDHKLCRMVNDHWVSALLNVGLNIVEFGDDISEVANKRVLFLSNHLGLADHFIIMTALHNKGTVVEKYLWVIFNIWKLTPLGAMWLIHGNFFINGGSSKREKQLNDFKEHLRKYYWKHDYGWLIMYPEGSRLFLIKENNKRFAEKIGHKVYKHCALPRVGAAHAALGISLFSLGTSDVAYSGLGKPIEYIVDCTIAYYKGDVANLGQYLMGEFPHGVSTVGIHYKESFPFLILKMVIPVKAEWIDESILKKWLYSLYEKKDELLDYYYKKNSFPDHGKTRPRPVFFPFSRFIIVEFFWIILFYFHYISWIKPLFSSLRSAIFSFF